MISHIKNRFTLHIVFFLSAIVFVSTSVSPEKAFAQAQSEAEALSISDVAVVNIHDERKTAEVVWNTNLYSQSWVVCGNYSRAPFAFALEKMTFGYTWGTILIPSLSKEHTVPLTELTPGTHYCRTASRTHTGGTWVVSDEIVFTVDDKNAPPLGKFDARVRTEPEIESVSESKEEDFDDEKDETVSLGGFFKNQNSDTCKNEWAVWLIVLFTLVSASFWSKEMRNNLSSEESVKRLYVLSGTGVLIFLIALVNDAGVWVVPIGIGTITIIVATITDVVRSVESIKANERLLRVIQVMYSTLLITVVFAFALKWTCSIIPIIITVLILMYRKRIVSNEN